MKKILSYLLFLTAVPLFAQSANNQITIKLSHSILQKYIALYVTDEVTKTSVYAESYSGKNQPNGTDAGGNFIRIVDGLTSGHSYSVTLLMDVDNQGSVNQGDAGKTINGAAVGSTVVMDALNPLTGLESIVVTANPVVNLAGKRATCLLSEASYNYPISIIAGAPFGLSGLSAIFFDASGNAVWNNMWVPPGNHGNMLCMIDTNADNILDSGDYYSIGVKVGSSNTNYTLGTWLAIP